MNRDWLTVCKASKVSKSLVIVLIDMIIEISKTIVVLDLVILRIKVTESIICKWIVLNCQWLAALNELRIALKWHGG